MSAHRSSYCRGPTPRTQELRGAAAPLLEVGVGSMRYRWVTYLLSHVTFGRESSHPSLATQMAGSKSFTLPRVVWESGKHHGDEAWTPGRADSPPPPPAFQGSECCLGAPSARDPTSGSLPRGEGIPAAGFAEG